MATALTPDLIRQGVQIVTDVRDQLRTAETGGVAPGNVPGRARTAVTNLDQVLTEVEPLGLTGDFGRAVRNTRNVRDQLNQIATGAQGGALSDAVVRDNARTLGAQLDEALRLAQNAPAPQAPGQPAAARAGAAAGNGNGTTIAVVYQGQVLSGVLQSVNGTQLVVVS